MIILINIWYDMIWNSLSHVWFFATHGLYSPWNSPGWNTGVGSLFLLQGIFPTQELNPGLPHCRRILYQLSHKGIPDILLQRDNFSLLYHKGEWENDHSIQTVLERWCKFLWLRGSITLRQLYLDPDSARYKLLHDSEIGFTTSLSLKYPIRKIEITKPILQEFCRRTKTNAKYLEQKETFSKDVC